MKLREIMNQNFDVRNYMSVGIDEETKEEIERSLVVDIDDINYILASAKIYIDGEALDMNLEELKKGRR
ncbi:hypothetical protein [Tetragenococcus halophilus]|nr:hypothetical protein [Tetragenococcus halophilus]NWN99275.1 hypothetical protein [Tetragenococcus halophilus]GBD74227.1 putative uncharacterized protein [Tetragenococcus halophilus subsp. halophilus]GBD76531.1 putative uncharacterized protein [Tetragenococcus halophilus subsp. halophilus]